jgi:hypothetical protein
LGHLLVQLLGVITEHGLRAEEHGTRSGLSTPLMIDACPAASSCVLPSMAPPQFGPGSSSPIHCWKSPSQ